MSVRGWFCRVYFVSCFVGRYNFILIVVFVVVAVAVVFVASFAYFSFLFSSASSGSFKFFFRCLYDKPWTHRENDWSIHVDNAWAITAVHRLKSGRQDQRRVFVGLRALCFGQRVITAIIRNFGPS